METQHPIHSLFEKARTLAPYPPGVVPIPKLIDGVGFFPGASGLWDARPNAPLPPLPIGQVMVLGHNFDSEAGYRASLANQGEDMTCGTWPNLLRVLGQIRISRPSCWFTNAYMGVIAGRNNTGEFPGSRDHAFVRRCQDFLAEQIATQRPRLIITLGAYVPPFIATLSRDLQAWQGCYSLKDLDERGTSLIPHARIGDVTATVVAATHPGFWGPNMRWRSYGLLRGEPAALQMLRDAKEGSGIATVTDAARLRLLPIARAEPRH